MASSAAILKAVEHGDVMAVARNLDAGVSIETKDVRAAPSPAPPPSALRRERPWLALVPVGPRRRPPG